MLAVVLWTIMTRDSALPLLRAALFLLAAVPITVIDLRTRRIPDALSLGGLAALAAFDLAARSPAFLESAAAGAFAFLLFWAVRAATKGLGFGDVKYAAMLGFFSGPRLLPLAFFTAAAGALAWALFAVLFRGRPKTERIPFGPFLSLGGLAAACIAHGQGIPG